MLANFPVLDAGQLSCTLHPWPILSLQLFLEVVARKKWGSSRGGDCSKWANSISSKDCTLHFANAHCIAVVSSLAAQWERHFHKPPPCILQYMLPSTQGCIARRIIARFCIITNPAPTLLCMAISWAWKPTFLIYFSFCACAIPLSPHFCITRHHHFVVPF